MALKLDKGFLAFYALGIVSTVGEIMFEQRKERREALRASADVGTDARDRPYDPDEHLLDDDHVVELP